MIGGVGGDKCLGRVKGKVHMISVRPVLYGLETVSVTKIQETKCEDVQLDLIKKEYISWTTQARLLEGQGFRSWGPFAALEMIWTIPQPQWHKFSSPVQAVDMETL
ncbi:hypothetical protein CRENBAI_013556 [Crenichthys baileyi]|uniref:Uncharacterized protein n=1 Tax=Crenichthys baileyi TaxID=28760 RepID=A0AAV9RLQ9_9TELE